MQALKQSTVTTILVGPVIDSAGAAVTTAVLADFSLTKNGTTATLTGATVTHSHNGHYTIALTTGNTDTLGRLTISVNNTAMAMVPYRYTVLAAAAFDTLVTNGTLAGTTSGRTIAVDASGFLTIATNNDKTGYSLTQSFPTNFSSLAITAGGAVTAGTVSDKTGYSLTQSFPANFGSLAITVGGAVTAGTVSDKTGYSLTPTTGLGNQTANITGNLSGSVGSVTSGVTVTTNNDKTGYSLASGGLAAVTTWTVAITGNITGNLSGSVGSVTGNVGGNVVGSVGSVTGNVGGNVTGSVASVSGDVAGKVLGGGTGTITGDGVRASSVTGAVGAVTSGVTVTTNNDKTGYSLATTPPTASAIADAVWDEARTGHTTSGTFGFYLDAAISSVSGGSGSADWTANERTAIRTILGIPGSGTTPADPSDGILYDIKQKTDQIGSASAVTSLLAGAVLDPGTITSFPSELVIGDSYQETDGREIQIPLVDTDGNVLTTVGSRNLADATATFEIRRINESDSTRVITGVATIVDPPGTGTGAGAPYAIVELPADETAKGLVSYRYKGKLTLTWSGPGTDVYSFDTETIKFTY